MHHGKKLIELKNAGIKIKQTWILNNLNLHIICGETIGIYGSNGSGKSLVAELLTGRRPADTGTIEKHEKFTAELVSSGEKSRLLEEERYNDDSNFMHGRTDPGRTISDILPETDSEYLQDMVKRFRLDSIMDRGIKFLSTGEFRKMMIVRALAAKPDLLVLDDPYTGLDIQTRRELEKYIPYIRKQVEALVIVSGRITDLQDHTERVYTVKDGGIDESRAIEKPALSLMEGGSPADGTQHAAKRPEDAGRELIRMSNVNLSYYDLKVLNSINWTVRSGEHWRIAGPNGSGKSTLLSLVNGDSPKAYGQEIFLFGKKRGSGETVWDIKKKTGTVSGALQQSYRISQSVLGVVVSGFFDSIGLYDKPDPVQLEQAEIWCNTFGLQKYVDKPFSGLSEGLKRTVLTVRAIVKEPELIILDEPCQGLDDHNSGFILEAAQNIIENNHSTLLYVSHDPAYSMKEITNTLELLPHPDGGYTSFLI